jgi:ABC-type transporter Mla MlaB component
MLKITIDKIMSETLLILEGSLSGPWVTELSKAVIDSGCQPDTLKLDLTGIQFVDEQGLLLIRDLMRWGVSLAAISPFIKELLKPPSKI